MTHGSFRCHHHGLPRRRLGLRVPRVPVGEPISFRSRESELLPWLPRGPRRDRTLSPTTGAPDRTGRALKDNFRRTREA